MTDKKFYWIKLKTDFFNQEAIDFLMSQENGCQYIVLYQMLCLQTANTNGHMATKIGEVIVPYDVKKIVRDTKYFDTDTVLVAMELFKKLGLIYEEENSVLRIANFAEMVGCESASKEAIKKREYRLRKKQGDILGDKKGTNCPTEYRDKSIEIRDKSIDKENIYKDIYINNILVENEAENSEKNEEKDVQKTSFCEKVINSFNEICVDLPKVLKITKARKEAIHTMLKKKYNFDDFLKVFQMAQESDFLARSDTWSGATFDWLMKERNFIKVLEGNYTNVGTKPKNKVAGELDSFYDMASKWVE